jgi:hypothetical protein
VILTFNQLSAADINPKSFDQSHAIRFYIQIVRAQLEYGKIIGAFNSFKVNKLEDAPNKRLCEIFRRLFPFFY